MWVSERKPPKKFYGTLMGTCLIWVSGRKPPQKTLKDNSLCEFPGFLTIDTPNWLSLIGNFLSIESWDLSII